MTIRSQSAIAAALALSLGLALSGCADGENNRSLNSVNQPVVEHRNYTLDLASGVDGVGIPEQRRLAGWFEAMNLRYGDRISVDGPLAESARSAVATLAGRYGLLLADGAPVTEGFIAPGSVRVIVTRARATVPGCPDWSKQSATNFSNATSDNYGCAINSNLAAMVADPQHLLQGATSSGETVVMSSSKAIATYRAQEPTGKDGLAKVSTQVSGGGN